MTVFKLYFNKDKETEFLNEMAGKGHAMTGFCAGFYSFDSCEPGEYVYQIDITPGMFRVSNDYREFMKDMNVEIVCLWGPWVILRKKAAEGPFVLYTDVESMIEHYRRIRRMLKIATVLEICCLFMELFAALNGMSAGLAFSCVIAAVILIFLREVARINRILDELRERIGEPPECRWGRRRASLFMPVGLMLNAAALMVPDFFADTEPLYYILKRSLQTGAILCMAIGIFLICRAGKN